MPPESDSGLAVGFLEAVAPTNASFVPVHLWQNGPSRPVNPDDFPNRGKIVLFQRPPHARERTIWLLEWTLSRTFDVSRPKSDKYTGELKEQLDAVIDLRSLDEDSVLKTVRHGFAAPLISPRIYIWIKEDVAVGPLDVIQDSGRWFVPKDALDDPVIAWTLEPSSLPLLIGELGHVTPPRKNWHHAGLVDWSSDATIIRRLLQNVRSLDSRFAESMAITSKAIERMSEIIEAGVQSAEVLLLQQRLNRAKRISPQQLLALTTAADIQDLILELPSVRKFVDDATVKIVATTSEATKTRIELELAEISQQVERLTTCRNDLDAQLVLKRQDLENLELRLSAEAASFEGALAERIKDATGKASQFVAESVLLRAAMNPTPSHQLVVRVPASESLRDCASALKQLQVRFAISGIDPAHAGTILALFTAGKFVVLSRSDSSMPLLTDVAQVLAEHRLLTIPMSPRMISFGDLMSAGAIDANGGFASVPLKDALSAPGPKVINLRGVNVVDFSLVVEPLFEANLSPDTILCGTAVSSIARLPIHDGWRNAFILDPTFLGLRRGSDIRLTPTYGTKELFTELRSEAADTSRCEQLIETARQHQFDLTTSREALNALNRSGSRTVEPEDFSELGLSHAAICSYLADREGYRRFLKASGLGTERIEVHLRAADLLQEG
ncbi:MAG: hypothetical protein ACYC7A_14910 [Thermoanaerobaculia bacterium]